MILLYPLLVSNTVSRNIIPGIAKVLESYLIVYRLDDIINEARTKAGTKIKKQGRKLIQFESEDPLVDSLVAQFARENEEMLLDQSMVGSIFGRGTKQLPAPEEEDEEEAYEYAEKLKDLERQAKAKEKGKAAAQEKAKDASVSLQIYNMQQISLEPTWIKTDMYDRSGNKYSQIIGVKAIPYAVRSDARLSNLLMYDKQMRKLERLVLLMGRDMIRLLYKVWTVAWKIATFGLAKGAETVTGDPRKDIILKRNILSKKGAEGIFVVANQAELSEDFISSAKGMINLQKLGWGSLIIADDVNRRAAFCMTELKGMCSLLPYTMLYQTMSQAKVFEDLEDAKRSASSIFKTRRKPFRKIIGESVAQEKTIDFGRQNLPLIESEILNEIYLIDENLGSFIKKLNVNTVKKIISAVVKGKANIPNVPEGKLIRSGMKMSPDFKKSYNLSKKVLSNSAPGVSKSTINLTSIMIALTAVAQKGEDVMVATKDFLIKFVKLFRKTKDKGEPKLKMSPEHYVEFAFGIAAIAVIIKLLSIVYKYVGIAREWVIQSLSSVKEFVALDPASRDLFADPAQVKALSWFETAKGFVEDIIPKTIWTALLIIVLWQISVSLLKRGNRLLGGK